jgi:hypothetical protein
MTEQIQACERLVKCAEFYASMLDDDSALVAASDARTLLTENPALKYAAARAYVSLTHSLGVFHPETRDAKSVARSLGANPR